MGKEVNNIGYLWQRFNEETGLTASMHIDIYARWLENQIVDEEYKNPNIPVKEEYRYYTGEEIQAEYERLSIGEKNSILYEAIEYMQQHNSRSVFKCIAMAMGYENYEGENNTYFKRGKKPE